MVTDMRTQNLAWLYVARRINFVVLGAESFVFQVAIQKFKDQEL